MAGGILSKALKEAVEKRPTLHGKIVLAGKTYSVGAKPISASDLVSVNRHLPVTFQNDPTQFDGQIRLLIAKAREYNEETGELGDPLFSKTDRMALETLGVDDVAAMFKELFQSQFEEKELDAEGN